MMPWSRSKKNEAAPENVDVEESGDIGEDGPPYLDDGVFVAENKRKRWSLGTREITLAAIGFAIFIATIFATALGVSVAVRRSSVSQATAFVDEQPQEDSTSYPMADLGDHLHHGGHLHDHDHRHDDHDHLDVRPCIPAIARDRSI